jgi:virulence factor Mce-like protein
VRRGGVGAIASSPTMVGAVTTLIVILAVFLAYNANNGLPFVPSYRISVQVPNAATLVPGNDVRIAGVRVGFVEDVVPVQHSNGRVTAKADLKLDKSVEPIPKGSTVVVRAQSALGLKYLEIDRSNNPNGYPEGATLALSAARPRPVEYDQVLSTFNGPTRAAIRHNLVQFGAVLAGRGPQINAALGQLRPLLRRLEPVARNLASKKTDLARFFREAGHAAAEVAPVAETQAHMFVSLDTTFGALASVARPFIQDTISETPPTFDTLIRTNPRISTFLRHNAALFADLRPGARALKRTSPEIASALETGARVLPGAPELNAQLPPTAEALERFATNPDVQGGISRSTQTLNYLSPTLRFVTPAQSVCNYGTLLFRNASSLLSIGDGIATSQRFLVMSSAGGPNNETAPASAPANKEGNETNGAGDPEANFLHSNPYPNTASPGQHPRECEAGNEDYLVGQKVIGNVPGNQGIKTQDQIPEQLK